MRYDAVPAEICLYILYHSALAWILLQKAQVAQAAVKSAAGERAGFYQGRLYALRYFLRDELPRAQRRVAAAAGHYHVEDVCNSFLIRQF